MTGLISCVKKPYGSTEIFELPQVPDAISAPPQRPATDLKFLLIDFYPHELFHRALVPIARSY